MGAFTRIYRSWKRSSSLPGRKETKIWHYYFHRLLLLALRMYVFFVQSKCFFESPFVVHLFSVYAVVLSHQVLLHQHGDSEFVWENSKY